MPRFQSKYGEKGIWLELYLETILKITNISLVYFLINNMSVIVSSVYEFREVFFSVYLTEV